MENNINNTYLIIGSNLGNRNLNLTEAAKLIQTYIGAIILQSSVYETEPWGISNQPAFYNQVLQVRTALDAEATLVAINMIENKMGRIRQEKYGARVIDIDILFFNDVIQHTDRLTIPHPRIAIRNFVLAPLEEIAANWVHPVLHKTVQTLWQECKDKLSVKKL